MSIRSVSVIYHPISRILPALISSAERFWDRCSDRSWRIDFDKLPPAGCKQRPLCNHDLIAKFSRTEIKAADPRSDLAVLQIKDRFQSADFLCLCRWGRQSVEEGAYRAFAGKSLRHCSRWTGELQLGHRLKLVAQIGNRQEMTMPPMCAIRSFTTWATSFKPDAKLNLERVALPVNLKGDGGADDAASSRDHRLRPGGRDSRG